MWDQRSELIHQLIMMNVRLTLKAKKGTVRTRKINVEAIKNEEIKGTFQTGIEQRWELLVTEKVEGIEEEWSKVKSIFQDASEKTLGYRKSKEMTEWISERTLKLMDERREYKSRRRESADIAKQHNYSSRMVKKSAKEDKEEFIERICSKTRQDKDKTRQDKVFYFNAVTSIICTHCNRGKTEEYKYPKNSIKAVICIQCIISA